MDKNEIIEEIRKENTEIMNYNNEAIIQFQHSKKKEWKYLQNIWNDRNKLIKILNAVKI